MRSSRERAAASAPTNGDNRAASAVPAIVFNAFRRVSDLDRGMVR
jgi:hypothetical protein